MSTSINNLPTNKIQDNQMNHSENKTILNKVMEQINSQTSNQSMQQTQPMQPMQPMQPTQPMHQMYPTQQYIQQPYTNNQQLEQKYNSQEETFSQIMNIAKEPLMVAGIFISLNFDIVNQLLSKYIPVDMFTSTGSASNISLVIRGLLAGVLFFLLKKIVKV